MKHCRFVTGDLRVSKHKVRGLEITAEDGFVFSIYVTEEPAFTILGRINAWHYEIKGDKISLTGVGSNSVNYEPHFHQTITNWTLLS